MWRNKEQDRKKLERLGSECIIALCVVVKSISLTENHTTSVSE